MDAMTAGQEGAHDGVGDPGAALVPLPLSAPIGGPDPCCACPRCKLGLDHLPRVACFCPRCGYELAEWPVQPPPWASLPFSSPDAEPTHSSVITRGYADAMYKLGRRYEGAVGARRNPGEAMRCYTKAARLGSGPALGRLAPRYEPQSPA